MDPVIVPYLGDEISMFSKRKKRRSPGKNKKIADAYEVASDVKAQILR